MEHFVWDVDPVIVRLGGLQIRYYGLLFAMVLLVGFHFLKRHLMDRQVPEDKIYPAFYWFTLFGVIGARVGHCLFYEPERYLSHPLEILYIWKGGLASHGGTIGLILAMIVYSRLYKLPFTIVSDMVSYTAAIAATFVRLGNFMNSEIVGRASDVPWAMHFPRFDDGGKFARHPSQLYEAAMGAAIFGVLYLIDRKFKTRAPRGLLIGTFLVLYFFGRFMVEFFKEYQTLNPESSSFTMGQYLSIPFFLLGWYFLFLAWKDRGRLTGEIPPDRYESAVTNTPQTKTGKKKKRK